MVDNPNAVPLTEDGHPIGELVIADNTSIPVSPTQTEIEKDDREAMLISEAQELTGEIHADTAVTEMYPEFFNSDKKKKAMRLFIVEQKSFADVARLSEVPERTVSQWAYTYHWDVLAKKELAARHSQSLIELERMRNSKRVEIAKKQLEQAEMIRDKAAKKIASDEVSLKSGTEAWAAAAKIEHTLTGVSESGSVTDIEGKGNDEKKTEGKQPLVVIFNGGLPPVRKHI